MIEAWGWTHSSEVYLTVFLLFLVIVTGCRRFKSTFIFYQSKVMLVRATQKSKMFPNLSERHCVISGDSLCSHATVIQSEPVEIHMHAFQRGGGRGGANGEQAASFS